MRICRPARTKAINENASLPGSCILLSVPSYGAVYTYNENLHQVLRLKSLSVIVSNTLVTRKRFIESYAQEGSALTRKSNLAVMHLTKTQCIALELGWSYMRSMVKEAHRALNF